jgi:peptide/nickel transport system substrate-binding protein
VQNTHGNSSFDGYVSLNGKLGCKAPQTPVCDDALTAILQQAAVASGDERAALLQQAAEYERENLVVLIPIAHLTDTVVITNDRLKYTPNTATSERLVIADMTLD